MKISVKATNISLTPSISDYIDKKMSSLDKFAQNEDILLNVEVGRTTRHHKSGDIFRAEVRTSIKGQNYYVVSEAEDLYAAIDEVKDEIFYKLSSERKKTLHLLRRGGAKIKNLLKGYLWPRKKSS